MCKVSSGVRFAVNKKYNGSIEQNVTKVTKMQYNSTIFCKSRHNPTSGNNFGWSHISASFTDGQEQELKCGTALTKPVFVITVQQHYAGRQLRPDSTVCTCDHRQFGCWVAGWVDTERDVRTCDVDALQQSADKQTSFMSSAAAAANQPQQWQQCIRHSMRLRWTWDGSCVTWDKILMLQVNKWDKISKKTKPSKHLQKINAYT